jgi:uncharacterized membrane protein
MTELGLRTQVARPARAARHRLEDGRTGLVLGSALIAMALIAGLFYAFSVAVMTGLAKVDDRTFVDTMQRINRAIQNPVFFLSFAGALVLTALAAVRQRRHGADVATRWIIAALVLYALVLAVTFAINIPLNDELDRAGDPDTIANLARARSRFEGPWVAANIVRTVLSTVAVGALARALFLHGRATAEHDRPSQSLGPPYVHQQTTQRETSIR